MLIFLTLFLEFRLKRSNRFLSSNNKQEKNKFVKPTELNDTKWIHALINSSIVRATKENIDQCNAKKNGLSNHANEKKNTNVSKLATNWKFLSFSKLIGASVGFCHRNWIEMSRRALCDYLDFGWNFCNWFALFGILKLSFQHSNNSSAWIQCQSIAFRMVCFTTGWVQVYVDIARKCFWK